MTTRVSARYNLLADLCLWLARTVPRFNVGSQKGRNEKDPTGAGRQPRDHSRFREDLIALLFLFGYLLVALFTDLYVLPATELISGLYAIPVLIAAHRSSPLAVGLTNVLAIVFYLISAQVHGSSVTTQELSVSALLIVGYLSVVIARQRQDAAQRAREYQDAQLQLQQFLAMVSHDLDQPLTVLTGHVQILSNGMSADLSPAKKRSLATVRDMTQRIRRLVDDIEDTSHIGANRFKVQPAPMDLAALARQIVEEQRHTATTHSLSLQAPACLEGSWDSDRLSQLLTNLISNAVRYSPKDSEVRVAVRQLPDRAVLSVSDNGIGIPPEQQDLLFRPFSRLDGAKARKGTGLGLYICKAIVEAHHGRIWVESEQGKGTSFHVSLPLTNQPA